MSSQTHITFDEFFAKAKDHLAYHVEGAIIRFTEDTCKRLDSLGMTRADLAREMGVEPAYVTKMLSGRNNFTIQTMVKVARALRTELDVGLKQPQSESNWIVVSTPPSLPVEATSASVGSAQFQFLTVNPASVDACRTSQT